MGPAEFPIWDSGVRASGMAGGYGPFMHSAVTIVAKLRPEWPNETWGLYLPAEDRWIDVLFHRELDARRFAKELMEASAAV